MSNPTRETLAEWRAEANRDAAWMAPAGGEPTYVNRTLALLDTLDDERAIGEFRETLSRARLRDAVARAERAEAMYDDLLTVARADVARAERAEAQLLVHQMRAAVNITDENNEE